MKKLILLLIFIPGIAFAQRGKPLKYSCSCEPSIKEEARTCGLVSLVGVINLNDGTEITVRDYYWFGGPKPNSHCYFPTEESALTDCALAIKYKQQDGICK